MALIPSAWTFHQRCSRLLGGHILLFTLKKGRLDKLPFGDGTLGGAVCWYSIIYTPLQLLDEAFAELKRVLVAGGFLLGFQAGGGETVQQGKTLGMTRSMTPIGTAWTMSLAR